MEKKIKSFKEFILLEDVVDEFFKDGYPTGESYSSIEELDFTNQLKLATSILNLYLQFDRNDFQEEPLYENVIDILFGCINSDVIMNLASEGNSSTCLLLITIFTSERGYRSFLDYYFTNSNWGRKRDSKWTTYKLGVLSTLLMRLVRLSYN